VRCDALQCVAVRCGTVQCVVVHCSVLQRVAVRTGVLVKLKTPVLLARSSLGFDLADNGRILLICDPDV